MEENSASVGKNLTQLKFIAILVVAQLHNYLTEIKEIPANRKIIIKKIDDLEAHIWNPKIYRLWIDVRDGKKDIQELLKRAQEKLDKFREEYASIMKESFDE